MKLRDRTAINRIVAPLKDPTYTTSTPGHRSIVINEIWNRIKEDPALDPVVYLHVMNVLRRFCVANLRKIFKNGGTYSGGLETVLLNESSTLRTERSKWARKRGRCFEELIESVFTQFQSRSDHTYFTYRNYAQYGFQPYDLAIYIDRKPPLLLECKANGVVVKKRSNEVTLQACSRRYKTYFNNLSRIRETIHRCNIPFLFVFGTEDHFYVVTHHVISNNVPLLFSKNVVLKPSEYVMLPTDHTKMSPSTVVDLLDLFYLNNSTNSST